MFAIILLSNAFSWEIKYNAQGKPLHWVQPEIPFSHNAEHAGINPSLLSQAVQNAANAWNFSYTEFIHKGDTEVRDIDYEDESFTVFFNDNWSEDWER